MVLFFSLSGEGKCEKNYKNGKKFFPPFGRFFDRFLVASLTEKMIRKCFEGKEKEYREKKSNFKKKV